MWPRGCSFELNTHSKGRPGLMQARFRRSNDENMNVGMDVKDLSDGLSFAINLHAGDWVVSTPKMASFAI